MAFVQHLLITSQTSSTCRRFVMNKALQNHAGINLRSCSLANSEKLGKFHSVVRLPCAFTSFQSHVLRVGSGCRIYPSRRDNHVPISFSTYGSSIARSFSKVTRAGTRNVIVMAEDGAAGRTNKAFAAQKQNAISSEELATSTPKKKVAAPKRNAISSVELATSTPKEKVVAAKDVNSLPVKGQNVENVKSVTSKKKQAPISKDKAKKQPPSNKTQEQASDAGTPTVAVDTAIKSLKNSGAKTSRSTASKKSLSSIEMNATSSTLTEVNNGEISTNNGKMVNGNSKRKSAAKSNKDATKKSNGNASPVQYSQTTLVTNSQRQKTWPQLYPPITKSVLVVESMTKAKVIQGYLGDMFEVLPSYGHVRDLAARSGSVRPNDDFSMVWEVPSAAWSHLKSIKVALSGADNLILASDPDREGEAIAWHILEMLQQQDALPENVTVARVVFNEITESSIKTALQTPRVIDANLVQAYLARRALDYLIGFNISPLLWRKLPGCQSAGRVQSAALALICEREKEIEAFKPQEYWTIGAEFQTKDPNSSNPVPITSHLTLFGSKKLSQLSICSHKEAKDIEGKINESAFKVIGSKTTKSRRNPPAPYRTSTLQQDAANKFNFTAAYTMKIAQKLYEGVQLSEGKAAGLITYMRTDGINLSDEAAKDIQSFVTEKYGQGFASKATRKYIKKVKNAQEAHEAIRPTDISRLPRTLAHLLDVDSLKLYGLIWSRTMACQMEPAIIGQIQVDIGNDNQSTLFRSTCSRVEFLGFKAAYEDAESITFKNNDDEEKHRDAVYEILSNLKNGQSLCLSKVELDQHHTHPPTRYSEGSLINKLEELGIGRPSTYATTIKVLKDRHYIKMESRALSPEFRGRMVSAFLSQYFSEVTDYCFTADMETELDNVSAGITEWKGLLKDYWTRFSNYCESASKVHIHQVEKMLENTFGDFLFSSFPDENRTCPSCMEGTLKFKVSKFGAGYFIGCDQHPNCKYIARTLYGEEDEETSPENMRPEVVEPKLLGLNPASNEKVLLKCGPYGYYVQLGEDRRGHLPKRASVSKIKDVNSITLEVALDLLKYPVTIGNHPDDGGPVIMKISKDGFTIKYRRFTAPLPKELKPSEINMEKALELLKGKHVTKSGRPGRQAASDLLGDDDLESGLDTSGEGDDVKSVGRRTRRKAVKRPVEAL